MSDIFARVLELPSGMIVPSVVVCLTTEQIDMLSNGCGPQGAKIDLIPDSIAGIPFDKPCRVHDVCYHYGIDEADKRVADRLFLFNLLVVIDAHCQANNIIDRIQRVACREAAFSYYKAVADWGKKAFWSGK